MPKTYPSAEHLRNLLDYDPKTGILTWRNCPRASQSGKPAGFLNPSGYISIRFNKLLYAAHKLAWLHFYGHIPKELDHINGQRSDNRICNLREVTRLENRRNAARILTNTSGVNGVDWMPAIKKWRARIHINNRSLHLGVFNTIEEAATARKAADARYGFHPNHGRF